LQRLDGMLSGREVRVDLPSDLPLLPFDFVLVVQALVNVLDNALKYSPSDTPIEIRAQVSGGSIQLEIADRGPGLPTDDLTRIFDKFYRGPHTSPGIPSDRRTRSDAPPGTGLGLSISSGIIEAHNGRIWAENRPGGGLVIKLTLPLEEKQL
ncbi:MAG: sensor histidine kinase KdpD, partial [Anaerolineales bacterium]|nr:sensor histidine kinase KdpD [Anaerolineales bacterium]